MCSGIHAKRALPQSQMPCSSSSLFVVGSYYRKMPRLWCAYDPGLPKLFSRVGQHSYHGSVIKFAVIRDRGSSNCRDRIAVFHRWSVICKFHMVSFSRWLELFSRVYWLGRDSGRVGRMTSSWRKRIRESCRYGEEVLKNKWEY